MTKQVLLIAVIILYSFNCASQSLISFKPLRYDENYSLLKNDSTDWYKKIKYRPLSVSNNSYISFGGEVRYQYFWFKNEDWGDAPHDKDGYILTRYLAHADFHAGKYFRTFIQLQSSFANGKEKVASPVDENQLDLHQAFADVLLPFNKQQSLTIRAGRQELMYGSQRLVAVRDGPNNRQSFDAVKLMYAASRIKADVFFSHYVLSKQKIFDDGFNKATKFWGAYTVINHIPFIKNIDFYYLGLWKSAAAFDDGSSRELRHSLGTRIWGKTQRWQYDFEGVYQFGKFGTSDIVAWTISSNLAYTFQSAAMKPQLGVKAELISGDKKYNDGRLNTFNPLFPRGAYFGLAALIGPSNLADIHPFTELELTSKLSWQTDYDIFWRMSNNDGIYGPNVKLIYSGRNSSSAEIGRQLGTALIYTPNDFLYFRAEFTWFNSRSYLTEAGAGKDILMTAGTVQLKF